MRTATIPILPMPPKEATMHFYRGKFRLAIIDALNVLGAATTCSAGANCPGCAYEREEALNILYGALGLVLDFNHPRESYDEYVTIRDALWHRATPALTPRLRKRSRPKVKA
jgi:hypothetical protein